MFQATTNAKTIFIRASSFPRPSRQQYNPNPPAINFTTSKPFKGLVVACIIKRTKGLPSRTP